MIRCGSGTCGRPGSSPTSGDRHGRLDPTIANMPRGLDCSQSGPASCQEAGARSARHQRTPVKRLMSMRMMTIPPVMFCHRMAFFEAAWAKAKFPDSFDP